MIIKDLKGVVFNVFNYKESDLIVDVFSQSFGFLQLYVRGGQKTTSKSFFVFNKFNIINFDLSKYNENGLSTYKSGHVIKSFDFINLSYEKINVMMYLEELLEKIKHGKIFSQTYYDSIVNIIDNLKNSECSSLYSLNYLLVKTLNVLGCQIMLEGCFYCNNEYNIKVFDYDVNGFVCSNCYKESINNTFLKEELIYLYNLNTYQKCDIINYSIEKKIFNYLSSLLLDNAGIYLVSQKYLL